MEWFPATNANSDSANFAESKILRVLVLPIGGPAMQLALCSGVVHGYWHVDLSLIKPHKQASLGIEGCIIDIPIHGFF